MYKAVFKFTNFTLKSNMKNGCIKFYIEMSKHVNEGLKFKYVVLLKNGTTIETNDLVEISEAKFYFEYELTSNRTQITSYGNSLPIINLYPIDLNGDRYSIQINNLYSLKCWTTNYYSNSYHYSCDALLVYNESSELKLPSLISERKLLQEYELSNLMNLMSHKNRHIAIFNKLVSNKSSRLNSFLQEKLDNLKLYYTDNIDIITQRMLERMMMDTILNLYGENKKICNELRELRDKK